VDGLDRFLIKAEQADDQELKKEHPDIKNLVLPTSYLILDKQNSNKGQEKEEIKEVTAGDEKEMLLSEGAIERDSMSYREMLEVIVDLPWSDLERVSPDQTNLKRFIKLPMVINVLAAAMIASLGLTTCKILGEVVTQGEIQESMTESIVAVLLVCIVMPSMQFKLIQAMMYY
jgi:hypothetical protein